MRTVRAMGPRPPRGPPPAACRLRFMIEQDDTDTEKPVKKNDKTGDDKTGVKQNDKSGDDRTGVRTRATLQQMIDTAHWHICGIRIPNDDAAKESNPYLQHHPNDDATAEKSTETIWLD